MNDLSAQLRALDKKDRDFYDNLNDEDRKKFSTYLMMRWSASVEGSADLQEWYLRATNEQANKYFWDLNHHPKLQWLATTTVSPNMGVHRHYWQSTKGADKKQSKLSKFAQKCYPSYKDDEIEILLKINDLDDWKQLAKQQGMSDKEIKQELG
jgi:succinate dehydrogenase flavin-adding protein (antitoxin of CptAB toxin-antitoxin module)